MKFPKSKRFWLLVSSALGITLFILYLYLTWKTGTVTPPVINPPPPPPPETPLCDEAPRGLYNALSHIKKENHGWDVVKSIIERHC